MEECLKLAQENTEKVLESELAAPCLPVRFLSGTPLPLEYELGRSGLLKSFVSFNCTHVKHSYCFLPAFGSQVQFEIAS